MRLKIKSVIYHKMVKMKSTRAALTVSEMNDVKTIVEAKQKTDMKSFDKATKKLHILSMMIMVQEDKKTATKAHADVMALRQPAKKEEEKKA
tara:strand:+ start:969 stop:1244 length:276 start_codon:yes stop_codon:yes gene_type:complete